MKVLFAIGSDKTSKSVSEKYNEKYGEKLEYKNVFYFKAILDEVKKDRTYDRIVISEELEQFSSSNVEAIDKFLFSNIDTLTDELQDTDIVFICSDRRQKGDPFLERLFSIGIYNMLIGDDRNFDPLCEIIKRPKNKREAKEYLNISGIGGMRGGSLAEDEVEEVQLINIIKHYEKLGSDKQKYIESFDKIAEQYSRGQLKVIVNCLNSSVQEVIRSSERYSYLFSQEKREADEEPKSEPTVYKPEKAGLFGIIKKNKEEKTKEQELAKKKQEEDRKKEEEKLKKKQEAENKARQEALRAQEEQKRLKEEQAKIEKQRLELEKAQKEKEEQSVREARQKEEERSREGQNKIEKEDIQDEVIIIEQKPKEVTVEKVSSTESPIVQVSNDEFEKEQERLKELARKQEEERKAKAEEAKKQIEDAKQKEIEELTRREEELKRKQEEAARKEEELKKQQERIAEEVNKISNAVVNYSSLPDDYRKIVLLVGANKSGTTFLANAIAHKLSSKGIQTAMLDMTRDRSLYYIYNQDDYKLRKIAEECMTNLSEGKDAPIPVNKSLNVYTAMPGTTGENRKGYRHKSILDTLKVKNTITVIDADFTTPAEYFEYASEIYIVQDLDILKLQETTLFLRELKNRKIDMSKIRVIINKYVKTSLTPKKIIEGLSYYNDPSMSFVDDLLEGKIDYTVIPYDLDNYALYVEGLYKNEIDYRSYTQEFLEAIENICMQIYPSNSVPRKPKRKIFG